MLMATCRKTFRRTAKTPVQGNQNVQLGPKKAGPNRGAGFLLLLK